MNKRALGLLAAMALTSCATTPPHREAVAALTCARDAYAAFTQGVNRGGAFGLLDPNRISQETPAK